MKKICIVLFIMFSILMLIAPAWAQSPKKVVAFPLGTVYTTEVDISG